MKHRRAPYVYGRRVRIFLVVLALVMIVVGIDMRIRPVVTTMSLYQGKVMATEIVNRVVTKELSENSLSPGTLPYSDLVMISRNSDNEITSLEINMLQANRLKSNITSEILKELAKMGEKELSIPIGTFLGSQILSGRGPKINLKIIPSGYVETEFENHFQGAGINQTLHQITLKVSTKITAILPGYTSSSQVTTDFIVAQTLINGVVPEAYLSKAQGGLPYGSANS